MGILWHPVLFTSNHLVRTITDRGSDLHVLPISDDADGFLHEFGSSSLKFVDQHWILYFDTASYRNSISAECDPHCAGSNSRSCAHFCIYTPSEDCCRSRQSIEVVLSLRLWLLQKKGQRLVGEGAALR